MRSQDLVAGGLQHGKETAVGVGHTPIVGDDRNAIRGAVEQNAVLLSFGRQQCCLFDHTLLGAPALGQVGHSADHAYRLAERVAYHVPTVEDIGIPAYQPRDPTQVADFRGSDGGSGRMAAISPITRGESTAAAKIVLLDQWV